MIVKKTAEDRMEDRGMEHRGMEHRGMEHRGPEKILPSRDVGSTAPPDGIWVSPVDDTFAPLAPLSGIRASERTARAPQQAVSQGPNRKEIVLDAEAQDSIAGSLCGAIWVSPADGTQASFAPLRAPAT